MSEESIETAAQEIGEQRTFAAPVVQLDEERWRACKRNVARTIGLLRGGSGCG